MTSNYKVKNVENNLRRLHENKTNGSHSEGQTKKKIKNLHNWFKSKDSGKEYLVRANNF